MAENPHIEEVNVTNVELVRILEGEPMVFVTEGGVTVRVQLGKAEVLHARHIHVMDAMGLQPVIDAAQFEAWAMPIEPVLPPVEAVQV